MTPRSLLLTVGTLALFLAVFVPLARRINSGRDRSIDARRLRQTYVALSLYESEHDGRPASNLRLVARDLDPTDLQSVGDPQVATPKAAYPLDPALPRLALTLPTRVSWSYRRHWAEAGDPIAVSLDPRRGLLADWWLGSVLRVNVDGSLVEAPSVASLTFEGLFGK